MVRNNIWGPIFILFFISLACSDKKIHYESTYVMPSQEWKVTNKVEGTWTQDDTLSALQVVLNISYTPDFAFQNLYISGEIQRGDLTLWKDTFSIQLAKPNSGQWLGRMEGNAIFISDTISDPISLSPGQRLSYQFSQFSRKEVLKGIDRVSVTIVDQ